MIDNMILLALTVTFCRSRARENEPISCVDSSDRIRGWANCLDIGSRRFSYANRGSSSFDNVSGLYKRKRSSSTFSTGWDGCEKNLFAIDSTKRDIARRKMKAIVFALTFSSSFFSHIFIFCYFHKFCLNLHIAENLEDVLATHLFMLYL